MGEKTTIITTKYAEAALLSEPGAIQYKGLRIHALAGLHEFVGAMARESFDAGSRVLDVAAGTGAMSQRLLDLGFSVCATDYVDSQFKLDGKIPFEAADLNQKFGHLFGGCFDGVVASEIIEHLENPRHFAREIFECLRPGGRLIITTPNIESIASRVLFLSSGRFLWFEDRQYELDGHISPISRWQLECTFREAGFRLLKTTSHGTQFDRLRGSRRLQALVKLVSSIDRWRPRANGEILVMILERP